MVLGFVTELQTGRTLLTGLGLVSWGESMDGCGKIVVSTPKYNISNPKQIKSFRSVFEIFACDSVTPSFVLFRGRYALNTV